MQKDSFPVSEMKEFKGFPHVNGLCMAPIISALRRKSESPSGMYDNDSGHGAHIVDVAVDLVPVRQSRQPPPRQDGTREKNSRNFCIFLEF